MVWYLFTKLFLFITDKDFWSVAGQSELTRILDLEYNTNKARNVILFLGDGMGNPSIVAARIFKGQKAGGIGSEEGMLEFENFPHVAFSKVNWYKYVTNNMFLNVFGKIVSNVIFVLF